MTTHMEFPIYSRINHGHSREEYVKHISKTERICIRIWDGIDDMEIHYQKLNVTTLEWDYREERYTPCTEQEYIEFLEKAYQLIKSK